MKVTLINPPWQFYSPSKLYPLGVSYLASHLIHCGFDSIDILDLNFEISDTQDVLKKSVEIVESRNANILGITCWTVHLLFCIEFVRVYKRKHPDVKIIMGGVHASSQPEEIMKLCPVDIVVRGEGEETIVSLLRAIEKNNDLNEVHGISYRKDKEIRHTPDRPLIKNLDEIPYPAYHLLEPIEKYQPLNRKYVFSLIASRGCPYKCIFCSANRLWKYQRRRNPKNILGEIKWLKDNYDVGFLRFEDDGLTNKRDWALEFFVSLKELSIHFDCLTRIHKVDSELLLAMRDAGCIGVYHGIESASPRLLKLLRKGFPKWVNIEYIKKTIAEEVSLGLVPTVSAMIGIPTETKKEIQLTFDLVCELKRLGAKTQLWLMTPYPDTEAVSLYKEELIMIDRWKELKQFDVFSTVPREAYSHLIKKYSYLVPDNWIFRNDINDFREMKMLYLSGASRILGELEFV
uniref:Putative anaerobic Mg-protoporphyrin IX monomethylester cyclase n=1 Tax=Desulfotignum phosphitoxidans TaxID=190898 RepID=A7UH63_9BACT|nr:putative anaerobic Mg-protoporphyrin IX monomethylester cyclase [Desulfotignum phosphitoxidans DSM 13687]